MAHHEKKEHEKKEEHKDGKHLAKEHHAKGMAKGGKGIVAGPAAQLPKA